MDFVALEGLIGLGVGGIIAMVVICWKRADDKMYVETIRQAADEHTKDVKERDDMHISSLDRLATRQMDIMEDNTKVMQQVATAVERLCALSKMEERMMKLEKEMHARTGKEA